jgi:hypothetical protein
MTTNLACDCVSCGDVFKLFVDWLVGFFSNTGIMITTLNQGCGIAMPDSYIEPAGQVDFPR